MSYTATITGKSIQRAARQLAVMVEFSDNGQNTFTESFVFPLNTTLETILLDIKRYVTRLEATEAAVASTIVDGPINLAAISEPVQTQAGIDKDAWFTKFNQLQQAKKLVDLGVLTGNETAYLNLKATVASTFKPAYINYM